MACRKLSCGLALIAFFVPFVASQGSATPPSSWPQDYPGKPSGDYSPAWQNYYRVTKSLTNATFPLGRSYAGNIGVQRAGHPNDTLFFWGFEKETGSLTAPASPFNKEPWAIWLNGGPGSSSFYGFFFENGPLRIASDYKVSKNPDSWDNLADYFWIDQPVGVGYSTADTDGYAADEDQIGRDFMGFLENLVKVFPSLKTRPLYLTGESYAGTYIPYILKTYFGMPNPPVNIAKIVIGDGTITSGVVFNLVPALGVVETFPQLIGYDTEVYKYFKEQAHLCHYDIQLTYPQTGTIPDVPLQQPRDRQIPTTALSMTDSYHRYFIKTLAKRYEESEVKLLKKRDRELNLELWKRDLSLRTNGTIDPWYGCFLFDMALDYALNYTYPWSQFGGIDVYDVADALNPQVVQDGSVFMNDADTREALHAPTSKDWSLHFEFPFGTAGRVDPSPSPMDFFTELATNATAKHVGIVLYSGNNDALVPHLGTEIAIQNTTFGGIQGFTKKPSTRWADDSGKFAGIIHQERGWTYALFYGTGHLVPSAVPKAAYKFLRDFVLGNNPLGSVVRTPAGSTTVIGGSDPTLAGTNLPAADDIYIGAGKTESTYIFPAPTRAAWKSFILTETAITTATPAAAPTKRGHHHHRALREDDSS